MKEINLNDGMVALVDDEDFILANSYKWTARRHGRTFRVCRDNRITINGEWISKNAKLHRFILKCKKGQLVDHIDGNPLNNQRSNLRICNHSQNVMNRNRQHNAASKFKGLTFRGNKNLWRARITLNGKRFHLGDFINQEEAALAYNEAAIRLHGEFARLNAL